jgi:RNA polymerase sigma factor (sigma-70 family)
MTRQPTAPLLRFLRGLAGRRLADTEGDARLLERFAAAQDAAAFAAILQRYGPLVWGVCRRVLAHEQDAEDAFQATFLVLVRKVRSVRRKDSLRSWLYGVALRVATRARDTRRRQPRPAARENLSEPVDRELPAADWRDVRPALDEEINALPEKYREPVVLCLLEGKTGEEAARELGCPRATVATRLARARQRLQARLARRGLAPSVALVVPDVSALLSALLADTCGAAVKLHGGMPIASVGISENALTWTEGVSSAMSLTRLKITLACLLTLGIAVAGAGMLTSRGGGPEEKKAPAAPPAKKGDAEAIQGTWEVTGGRIDGAPLSPRERESLWMIGPERIVWLQGGSKVKHTYKLDPAGSPREIHLTGGGKEMSGVYLLKGDSLRVCLAGKGRKATEFTAPRGSKRVLVELKRLPDARALQGRWKVVSGNVGGKAFPPGGPQLEWIITPDKITYLTRGKKDEEISYTPDPSAKPRAIDLTGPAKKRGLGIYQLTGDELTICFTTRGPRPKDFKAGEGTGRVLLVFERLEPPPPEADRPGGGKEDPATLRRENQLLRDQLDRAKKIIKDLRLLSATNKAEWLTRRAELERRLAESQKKIEQLEKEVKRLKQGKEPGRKK